MEKINVEKLFKSKSKETKTESIIVEKKFNPEKQIFSSLNYTKINKLKNETTLIRWSYDGGIRKTVYQVNNPIKKFSIYYKNGNLREKYNNYIGDWKKEENGRYTYSWHHHIVIGKLYSYDISGNIVKEVDFDKNYGFSIYSLIELLENQYVESVFYTSISQKQYFETKEYYWEVIYRDSEKDYPQILHIDSKTGKVTEKGDFIVTEM